MSVFQLGQAILQPVFGGWALQETALVVRIWTFSQANVSWLTLGCYLSGFGQSSAVKHVGKNRLDDATIETRRSYSLSS